MNKERLYSLVERVCATYPNKDVANEVMSGVKTLLFGEEKKKVVVERKDEVKDND